MFQNSNSSFIKYNLIFYSCINYFKIFPLLFFKNSTNYLNFFCKLSLDNFNKILFLSLISHLLDGKKYKFFISSYENLDLSIIFLKFKNSLIFGFPKINGNF